MEYSVNVACEECSGELPTIYDVEELDAALLRHPAANPLQVRVDEIRDKARRQQQALTQTRKASHPAGLELVSEEPLSNRYA